MGDDGGIRLSMNKRGHRSGRGFPSRGFGGRCTVLLFLWGLLRGGVSGGGFSWVEVTYRLTHFHLCALWNENFDCAIRLGKHFGCYFICFDLKEGLA